MTDLYLHFFVIYTQLLVWVEDVLCVGVSWTLALVYNTLTLADDILGGSLATLPWVHTVRVALATGIADVAGDTVRGFAFISLILTWNKHQEISDHSVL